MCAGLDRSSNCLGGHWGKRGAPGRLQLAGNEGGGAGSVRLASAAGRWVLAVAVLGDAMILLEATVVNVALPTIGRNLGAGVAGLAVDAEQLRAYARGACPGGRLAQRHLRPASHVHPGGGGLRGRVGTVRGRPDDRAAYGARFVQGMGGLCLHQAALRSSRRSFIPITAPRRSARGWPGSGCGRDRPDRRRVPDRRGVVARGLPDQYPARGFRRHSRGPPRA